MRKAITLVLLIGVATCACALDRKQAKINNIKKSKEYLYSDITMSTREAAISQAFNQLQQEILAWASDRTEKNIETVSLRDINQLVDTLQLQRVNMYRVFAYVKKTKLVPMFNEWDLVLLDNLDSDDGIINEEDELPEASENKSNVKKQEEVHPEDSLANKDVLQLLRSNFLGKKGGVIEQIKKARNFFDLKQIMEPLKERGDITAYGKYATAEKPEDCYLIVYDPAGNIKALLGKGEQERPNLKTGKDDSLKNYSGCGAIWFTLNE